MSGAAPQGRLIAVVGPSGVGKDSVMDALVARHPALGHVRRAVTRSAEAGGETIESLTPAAFEEARADGAFVLDWQAHGLSYGIPATECAPLAEGRDLLVNLSRGVLAEASARFPSLIVLSLTARTDVLARRLAARGRESRAEIAERLSRWMPTDAGAAPVLTIDNSGDLDATVASILAALYPASSFGTGRLQPHRFETDPK
ncbi:phosphonate metabolism protein/1,5-bisphosphokinase (PRPP-forming) PhnN [Roseovarius aquimarinus]|uniref:Ribose 1,5-bisphosphate phosphokinase PhnN n=1 Tax=Roseovarius aquimarinus TaxID=1229156 RepID=A0ABW7I5Q3_9RHOB